MRIAVIGGGISGLAVARRLHDLGHEITLFEAEEDVGGLARSRQVGDAIFNVGGGHAFSPKIQEVTEWLFSVLPKEEWNFRERVAKIFFSGRLITYPFELFLHELPVEEAVDCAYDYLMAQKGEEPDNFREWLTWNFGRSIAEYYMLPYNAKIWSYPLEKMEIKWVQGKMPLPEKKDILRSLLIRKDPNQQRMPHTHFYYPLRGGMQSFLNAVAAPLHIKKGQPVQKAERESNGRWKINGEGSFDKVISTIPLPCLPTIMYLPDQVCLAIRDLKYNSLTTLFFICPANDLTDLYIPEKRYRSHRICLSGTLDQ